MKERPKNGRKNERGGRGRGRKETLADKPLEFASERSAWSARLVEQYWHVSIKGLFHIERSCMVRDKLTFSLTSFETQSSSCDKIRASGRLIIHSPKCLLDLNNEKQFSFVSECDGFLKCFVLLDPARWRFFAGCLKILSDSHLQIQISKNGLHLRLKLDQLWWTTWVSQDCWLSNDNLVITFELRLFCYCYFLIRRDHSFGSPRFYKNNSS